MSVLIHACTEIHESMPEVCSCRQTMNLEDVKFLVKLGVLEWVGRYSSRQKKTVVDYKNAFFTEIVPKSPRAATIEQEHIEYAYVDGNRRARMRIEEFGRLQREFYKSLTRSYDFGTLFSAKHYLHINGNWCFGRGTAAVDNGDLVKPLEEANDKDQPVVGSTEKSSSGGTQVPRGVSSSLVRRSKRRARKNDSVSGLRPAPPSSQLTVPPKQ